MSLFRLIFWGILGYLGYKLVRNWFQPNPKETEVHGQPESKPLDIDESQIEDADFREVDDENEK
jgi:hypothetical protein